VVAGNRRPADEASRATPEAALGIETCGVGPAAEDAKCTQTEGERIPYSCNEYKRRMPGGAADCAALRPEFSGSAIKKQPDPMRPIVASLVSNLDMTPFRRAACIG
jgi:hypothetical protein